MSKEKEEIEKEVIEDIGVHTVPYVRIRYSPPFPREAADLILEFFMVFSRFEFALKQAWLWNNDRGYLKPDWTAFAQASQGRFDPNKTPELAQAYNYYLSAPPKIQEGKNGLIGWKRNHKRNDETDFAWIIRSIGVVRNNLFHGGKFPWDQIRDTTLLAHGLIILYECLELDEEVHRSFFTE